MKPIALRSKLTLFYTSVLALFIVAIAIAYYHTLRYHLNSSITEELLERSAGIRGYIRISNDDAGLTYDETDPDELFFVETATRLFQIQRIRDGEIKVQSPAMRALGLRFTPSEIAGLLASPALHDIRGPLNSSPHCSDFDQLTEPELERCLHGCRIRQLQ